MYPTRLTTRMSSFAAAMAMGLCLAACQGPHPARSVDDPLATWVNTRLRDVHLGARSLQDFRARPLLAGLAGSGDMPRPVAEELVHGLQTLDAMNLVLVGRGSRRLDRGQERATGVMSRAEYDRLFAGGIYTDLREKFEARCLEGGLTGPPIDCDYKDLLDYLKHDGFHYDGARWTR